MRKMIFKAVGVLVIVLSFTIPAMAASSGDTQAQVSFYETTTRHYYEDGISPQIPNGQAAYHVVTTKNAHQTGQSASGWLMTKNANLRLPQTAEAWTWYWGVLGLMILAVVILSELVWREKKAELMGGND